MRTPEYFRGYRDGHADGYERRQDIVKAIYQQGTRPDAEHADYVDGYCQGYSAGRETREYA